MKHFHSANPLAQGNTNKLAFRSIFMHAWDFADHGVDDAMEWVKTSGLNTICLAAVYHSGWFIHPQNRKHRAFMSESGACYFHPKDKFYKSGRGKLLSVASISRRQDWFQKVGMKLDRYDLKLVAWVVGTHNTRMGLAFPEFCQQNVYGDRLPHALCPVNSKIREYLLNLCRNIAVEYPVSALQLESFGWSNFAHGHHHERDLIGLTCLEQELMSLCFCYACSSAATRANINIKKVKNILKTTLDVAFREAPSRPTLHPKSMADLEEVCLDLKVFNQWRKKLIEMLIKDIKLSSLQGTECRLLLQCEYDADLAGAVDGFACAAYEKNAQEVSEICRKSRRLIPNDWPGLHQCFIQLGKGVPRSKTELGNIIRSVRSTGCDGINFYNRSESPPKMLGWLAEILPSFCK